MGEFDLIARYLRPLAGEGAMDLRDDAARAYGRVLSKDVLVEGTHFLPTDPLDLLAQKALRVNMSDLIAKGATPEAYMLGIVWPKRLDEAAFSQFAEGLDRDQKAHGLQLLGGDTTRGEALVISVTMFGAPCGDRPILRSGGRPGDCLCVSGTIGDGFLGLQAALAGDEQGAGAFHLPKPPFGAERSVAAYAQASLDVSDGLIADARHLAKESGLALRIRAEAVPLSDTGRRYAGNKQLTDLLTGGDDYQTLCLVGADDVRKMSGFTVIGEVIANGVAGTVETVLPDGRVWQTEAGGWDHFAQ